MRVINVDILRAGDIVLTTSPAFESKVIRGVTKSDISHAMLCVSQSSVMDSTGEGVQARNPAKMLYPDECEIHILRFREALSLEAIGGAVSYVRQTTGVPYTTAEAMRSILPMPGRASSKQFCSRLVARAFASVGIQLCDNPDFCTPEALRKCDRLYEVEPAWNYVSEDEAGRLKESDATEGMRQVTIKLLKAARLVLPAIEGVSDIAKASVERPDLDGKLADALLESGYLDYWRTQEALFPWRYDFAKLMAFSFETKAYEEITEYCEVTLAGDSRGEMAHWMSSLEAYEELCVTHQRRVLELERGLYRNLFFQHEKRVMVAQQWMRLARRMGLS